MNLKIKRYKAIALGLGLSLALLFSGCKDFLDREVEDQYGMGNIKTMEQYVKLTGALYGGKMWIGYHTSFAWTVNEALPGNLLRVSSGQDGALSSGDVAATNGLLNYGFQSLFSGVISTANFLVNMDKSTLTEEQAKQIEAEARMFRGFAYFLVTEYWGEVPLVRNNEKIMAENLKVPKANRATLYRAIEEDLLFAAKYLPEDRKWMPGRASCWSAKGMLAKLYLQMASCQADVSSYGCPYICPDPMGYYQKAIAYATDVIDNSKAQLVPYADIFKIDNGIFTPCEESLFSLNLSDMGYNEGAHWQCYNGAGYGPDDAPSEEKTFWSPNACWGGWNSMTYTLAESYYDNGGTDVDLRKRECILYPDGDPYYNWKGEKAPFDYAIYGIGSLTQNNIKKYIYGYSSSIMMMSNPQRMDFLRLADVYLIRAEAKMALAASDVEARTSAGLEDLRIVLLAHAGPQATADLPASLPYSCKVPFNRELTYEYDGWWEREQYTLSERDETLSVSMMGPTKRVREYTDFVQERRKELVFEGHGWIDVKRLFYRNPKRAQDYFKEQDRGWCFTRKWGQEVDLATKDGYARMALRNKLDKKYGIDLPKDVYNEPPIALNDAVNPYDKDYERRDETTFFTKWFLPIPQATAEQIPSGAGQDFTDQLDPDNYTYPY